MGRKWRSLGILGMPCLATSPLATNATRMDAINREMRFIAIGKKGRARRLSRTSANRPIPIAEVWVELASMLRYYTAGESHGKALVALVDGFPAGVELSAELIDAELRRRQGDTAAAVGSGSKPTTSRSSAASRTAIRSAARSHCWCRTRTTKSSRWTIFRVPGRDTAT